MKAYAKIFKRTALIGILSIPVIYIVFYVFANVLPHSEPLRRFLVGMVITLIISQIYDDITIWSITARVNLNTERINSLEEIVPLAYVETPKQRELEKALEKGIGERNNGKQCENINT